MADNLKEKATKSGTGKPSLNLAKVEFDKVYLSPAPHFVTPVNTQKLMLNVIIALTPVCLYAVYLYGVLALMRILISIICTVGFESVFRMLIKRPVRIKDLSAIVTGLMLACVMPASIPIWMLILSAFCSVVIAKEFFGGLGKNPFNPALVGRAIAFASFAKPMTTWIETRASSFFGQLSGATDALSGATPLARINPVDGIVTSAEQIAQNIGLEGGAKDLYLALFFGNHRGSMGETPIFLILISLVFLIITKTIAWQITASMLGSAVVGSLLLGIDPLLTLLSGGLMFGAVFMATDYSTSPVTPLGRIVFGKGCGALTVILRVFSTNPEGVMFSILIMNAIVPFLNNLLPKKYGYVKGGQK